MDRSLGTSFLISTIEYSGRSHSHTVAALVTLYRVCTLHKSYTCPAHRLLRGLPSPKWQFQAAAVSLCLSSTSSLGHVDLTWQHTGGITVYPEGFM